NDINAGGVYNIAIAYAVDVFGNEVQDSSEDTDPLGVDDPNYDPDCPDCTYTELPFALELDLFKEGIYIDTNGDGIVNLGDQIEYTFEIVNVGTVTIDGLLLEDPTIGIVGMPFVPDTIDPTESSIIVYYYD